jgi:hypothetical protein
MRCAVIVGLLCLVGGVAAADPPVIIVTKTEITYTPGPLQRPHSEAQLVFPTQPNDDDPTEVLVFLGLGVLTGLAYWPRPAR